MASQNDDQESSNDKINCNVRAEISIVVIAGALTRVACSGIPFQSEAGYFDFSLPLSPLYRAQ